MDWQWPVTGVVVAGCMLWSAWTLMPAALRTCCRRLIGARPPADAGPGCSGCSGCGGAPRAPGAGQVVRIVRRGGG